MRVLIKLLVLRPSNAMMLLFLWAQRSCDHHADKIVATVFISKVAVSKGFLAEVSYLTE